MAKNVILYPKKSNAGGNPLKGWAVPENLVPLYLKNGFQRVPDISNPKVAEGLVEMAQKQVGAAKKEIATAKEQLDKERELFAQEQAEWRAQQEKNKSGGGGGENLDNSNPGGDNTVKDEATTENIVNDANTGGDNAGNPLKDAAKGGASKGNPKTV